MENCAILPSLPVTSMTVTLRNASAADIAAITDFAADRLQVSEIHYLPYHTLGMNKYQLLSQPYTAPDKPLDAPELLAFAQDYARSKGLTAILRG